jgi:hypothetical protein
MREQLNIQISDDRKAKLYQLAEQLGYTRRVGTTQVGNISALFEAIADGKLTVSRKERKMTLIAKATILHSDSDSERITLELHEEAYDGERHYRWLEADGTDTEVSAPSIPDAIKAAWASWPSDPWDFQSEDWYDFAERRVDDEPELGAHRDYILYDWPEGDEHWMWVATAPTAEILQWVAAGERQEA